MSGELGDIVVYPDMPIVLLEKDQEVEIVARANFGKGVEHAKFSPGLVFYRIKHKIEIEKEAEKQAELAEIYPKVFEFDEKLKVKNEWAADFDEEDLKDYKGIKVTDTNNLMFFIESWGQMPAKDIFIETLKVLGENLEEVSKAIK